MKYHFGWIKSGIRDSLRYKLRELSASTRYQMVPHPGNPSMIRPTRQKGLPSVLRLLLVNDRMDLAPLLGRETQLLSGLLLVFAEIRPALVLDQGRHDELTVGPVLGVPAFRRVTQSCGGLLLFAVQLIPLLVVGVEGVKFVGDVRGLHFVLFFPAFACNKLSCSNCEKVEAMFTLVRFRWARGVFHERSYKLDRVDLLQLKRIPSSADLSSWGLH